MADATPPPGGATPPTGNDMVAFDRASADRTRDATLYVERFYRGGGARRGVAGRGGSVPGYLAKLGGSTIAARSGTTLGSGTVTIYAISGGALTATSDTVTAYNLLNKVIAANSYVALAWCGEWVITAVDDCAHLS